MKFYIVDVFAEQKYQGNPLAVLIPIKKLSDREMQHIAKEINFSETTFIISNKQTNGGYDVRIFTPDRELPFAGHPSLGTAFIIRQFLEVNQHQTILLNLTIGQIPVTFSAHDSTELSMEQKPPTFGKIISISTIAEILQIDQAEIDAAFPIQEVSTGLPAIIVPLKNMAAVKRCAIQHEKFQTFIDKNFKANLLVFATETQQPENDLHVRVFMDDPGFLEDPATGSANGNLAAHLLEHNFLQTNKINLRVEQGYEMGRPSLIKIIAEKINDKFRIQVGGKVFLVAQGEWL